MKLASEFPAMVQNFKNLGEVVNVMEYAEKLHKSRDYNDFCTRLAWDCFRVIYSSGARADFYDELSEKYPDYTDQHLTTLLKKSLLTAFPQIKKFEA